MNSLLKIITLLLISILVIPSTAAGNYEQAENSTIIDNSTEIKPVESVEYHEQTADNDNYEDILADQQAESKQIEDSLQSQKKILPSRDDVLAFAKNSDAKDNKTLEEQLIAHNSSWYFDTYLVKAKAVKKDGKVIKPSENYPVVVVYDNEKTKTDYGRVQLYANSKGIAIVNPTPMLICRPLNITAMDRSWSLSTASVDTYKIVYSHFGDTGKKLIIQPDEPGCPVEVDNSSQPITVPQIENSTVINASENQNKNHNVVVNSKGIINNQGNGNIINQFLLEISNIKNNIINLYINYGGQ
jgi:hypothetical protein